MPTSRICESLIGPPVYVFSYAQWWIYNNKTMNILWFLDIVSCGDNYTPWNAHEYKMTTLDRQRPDCGSEKVLTMFHLQRDAANIRYHYTCCHFKQGVLKMQSRTSLFDYDGHLDGMNGDMVFLDRHAVNCSANGFVSAFRVERNISSAEVFIHVSSH